MIDLNAKVKKIASFILEIIKIDRDNINKEIVLI